MKQTNKLKMIAAIAVSILSFTITGCSSDELYGFDDNFSEYGNEEILSFNNDLFLSISTSDFYLMTDVDYLNLSKAIARIENDFNNGATQMSNNGIYNISDTLYMLAYTTLENKQLFLSSLSSDKTKRKKNNNRELNFTISGKDCVGQAIAYSLYPNKVDSINSILANHFSNYYSNGIPYASLETAFDLCGANYSKNTNLYVVTNSYDVVIIKPTQGDYHAMNINSVVYDSETGSYIVWCRDKNYNDVPFVFYGTSLPRNFYNNSNQYKMLCFYHLTKKTNSNQ